MKKRMKRRFSFLLTCVMLLSTMFSTIAFAADNTADNLTPYEINEILKDVEPVEVSPGVYLRDNGEVSIFDIDVSQFEPTKVPECPNDGEIILKRDTWDLSTPYYGSFKAKYRVLSNVIFIGYDEFYVQYFDVACPSGSEWKSALYINWDEVAASGWLSSSTTTYTSRFYNLSTSSPYKVAFVKTDNGDEATGNLKVYK